MRDLSRKCLAGVLCCACAGPLSWAQVSQTDQALPIKPAKPFFFRSYRAPEVPELQLTNSSRLAGLIRAGKLYLTVQDAIALAIENNIDVQVARYTPIVDAWNLERAEAGGALPGVPTASSKATSVAQGQGVTGSESAAGVGGGGGGGGQGSTVNGTISQVGVVAPTLDPVFQDSTYFSHLSHPQSNSTVSQVLNLVQNTRNYTASLQSGYLLGGQASITYSESYLNENSPTDVLNPTYAPTIQANIQQPLFLQGFGIAVNSSNINVRKLNLKLDDLNFKSQIISVVVNVLNLYYGLVADYDDVRAKRSALDVAQQFYQNNKKQVELGTLAPLDITTAEAQVASSEQTLVSSQVTLAQQQISLKGVLSRIGSADPLLADVEIIPLDRIDVPQEEALPSVRDEVAVAMKNRVDIASERGHVDVDRLSDLSTANAVLPNLVGVATTSQSGQAGTNKFVPAGALPNGTATNTQYPPGFAACPPPNVGQVCEIADPSFRGGVGTALGQLIRRDYPTEGGTLYFGARIRNRQAQADAVIDKLTMRQDQLQVQKDISQVAVDVSNQLVALQQARVRYLAAVKNRVLEQQLLDAEQKRFSLGASTPYLVVTQQRDLATAQSTETAALAAYSNARVALGQTVGTTLEDTHVSIADAKSGRIAHESKLPDKLPAAE